MEGWQEALAVITEGLLKQIREGIDERLVYLRSCARIVLDNVSGSLLTG